MTRPFMSLLTDFGLRDPSAAICHGVIASIAPEAIVVDVSHEVRKYAIRDGALLLWCALPHLPVGVHVAVVDPGVGTERRPIAVRAGRGDVLVGPDNGLLLPALDRIGGLTEARVLDNRALFLEPVSASFHGRDIFSPVGAHLAAGDARFEEVGPAVDPATLVALGLPPVTVADGRLETGVVYVDTFGNVKLAGLVGDLVAAIGPLEPGDPLVLEIADPDGDDRTIEVPWASTFGERPAGAALVYEDSYGRGCVAVNQGDAAAALGLREDLRVVIRRA